MMSTAFESKDSHEEDFEDTVNNILAMKNEVIRTMTLNNLRMAVQGQPEEKLLQSLTDPDQARAVIHITEPKAQDHTATAVNVGKFLQLISKTVNEVAKTRLRAERRKPQLLVAAFSPGSLAVTLEAPSDITDSYDALPYEEIQDPESVESAALKKVAMVLTVASAEDSKGDDSTLEAQLHTLNQKARATLNTLTHTVKKSDWTLSGTIVQKKMEPIPISFTQDGVKRMAQALKTIPEKPEKEELYVYLDGYKRSEGILFVKQDTDKGKGSYKVAVDSDLIQKVAIYATHSNQKYRVEMEVYKTLDKLGDIKKTSRLLKSIKPVDDYSQSTIVDV